MNDEYSKENELEEVEMRLLQENEKKKKIPMPVSGKGVFDIKRIKENKKE